MDLSLIFDFFEDLERNPKRGLKYSAIMLVFSTLFLLLVPNWILSSYDKTTAIKIQTAVEIIHAAEEREAEQMWFNNRYLVLDDGSTYEKILEDATNHIENTEGARSYYTQADSGWPADRIRFYELAQSEAQQANDLASSVLALFDRNENLRQQVIINQQSLTEDLKQLAENQELSQTRFSLESEEWLLIYMDPLDKKLQSSNSKLETSGQFILSAISYMPDLTNLTHQGDPQMAQDELDHAQALINEMVVLQEQVTSGLDYQIEARNNTPKKIDEALLAIRQANQRLSEIDSQYHWGFVGALLQSSNSATRAQANLDIANQTIENPVPNENKIDWPTAYEAAKLSISQAHDSVEEANQQVLLYVQTNDLLAQYSQMITGVNNDISSAESAWNVISTYHSLTTWEGKQNNLNSARSKVTQSEEARDSANIHLFNQDFAEAKNQAEAMIDRLRGASDLCNEIISLKNKLEGYRSSWSSKASTANSTIESNRSKVNTYGSYDYNAVSDFNEAVSLLSRANAHAASHEYEQAYLLADKAITLASGTGQRAENAYDDEMARQAEEARRAAAAEEAAEEAARQAASDDSSSSSCCDSFSSSDDGGGSSSSSYDDGGGYDSSPSYDDGDGY